MPPAVPIARMTYAKYLASEAANPVRREFIRGQVYAMADGTPEHGALEKCRRLAHQPRQNR